MWSLSRASKLTSSSQNVNPDRRSVRSRRGELPKRRGRRCDSILSRLIRYGVGWTALLHQFPWSLSAVNRRTTGSTCSVDPGDSGGGGRLSHRGWYQPGQQRRRGLVLTRAWSGCRYGTCGQPPSGAHCARRRYSSVAPPPDPLRRRTTRPDTWRRVRKTPAGVPRSPSGTAHTTRSVPLRTGEVPRHQFSAAPGAQGSARGRERRTGP
jgi:hypothetical protein